MVIMEGSLQAIRAAAADSVVKLNQTRLARFGVVFRRLKLHDAWSTHQFVER
ncbi:hypothetical protein HYC85_000271 [Camellia sinensis]|uniref:Uncharacterized protein n=1 Tax=Camellia sinensis TaxID=4442 RepID=A0A7J7I1Z0_CAMSI|nr:hypothetical protein HYC85_000271 [Camellia sinensis]